MNLSGQMSLSLTSPRGGGSAGAGVTTNVTANLGQTGRQPLMTGAALTAINGVPGGNTVTLTQSVATPIELSYGAIYTTGDFLVPAPSADWVANPTSINGGFGAWSEDNGGVNNRTAPPDTVTTGGLGIETRTTFKPCLRPLTLPHQRFTGRKQLAWASDGPEGVSFVRVFAAGSYVDITSRKWVHYTDTRGRAKKIYAWVCELDSANYTAGSDDTRIIRVYARAYPVAANGDAGQTYLAHSIYGESFGVTTNMCEAICFFPATTEFGYEIWVDPLAADSRPNNLPGQGTGTYAGVLAVFTTPQKALQFITGVNVSGLGLITTKAPAGLAANIVWKGTGVQTWSVVTGPSYPKLSRGYSTFTHDAAITKIQVNKATFGQWDVGYLSLHFKGAFEWDNTNLPGFNVFPSSGSGGTTPGTVGTDRYWPAATGNTNRCDWIMDREVDDSGYARNPFALPAGTGSALNFKYQFDCDWLWASATGCFIVVNNTRTDVFTDIWGDSYAVFGDRTFGGTARYFGGSTGSGQKNAFTITHDGTGGVGVIRKNSLPGVAGNITLEVPSGNVVCTIPTASFPRILDVVNEINRATAGGGAASGFAATIEPGLTTSRTLNRNSWYLNVSVSPAGAVWVSPALSATPYQMATWVDIHLDVFQNNGNLNSAYYGYCEAYDLDSAQGIFTTPGILKDTTFENNAIETIVGDTFLGVLQNISAVVVKGCAFPNQAIKFVTSPGVTWADKYCRFDNNIFKAVTWIGTAGLTSYPVVRDCHFVDGFAAVGSAAPVNVSSGSTMAGMYPGVAAGYDWTPASPLTDNGNLVTNRTPFDVSGAKAIGTVPKGPKFSPMGNGSLTKAQALELSAITTFDTVGAAVGTATLSWTAAGGATDSLVLTFNVA